MKIIKQSQSGFTLIELMITVAIVAILAAIAIPAYQDYVARSQVAEALSLVSGAKPLVAEFHSNNGAWPTQTQVGYSGATGKYISGTSIGTNGVIIATLGGDANSKITGQSITLTPTIQPEGNISWNCTSSLDAKYLPSSCTHVDASNGGSNSGSNNSFGNNYYAGVFSYQNGQLSFKNFITGAVIQLTPTGTASDGTVSYDVTPIASEGTTFLTMRPDGMVQFDVPGNITNNYYPDGSTLKSTKYEILYSDGTTHTGSVTDLVNLPNGYNPPNNIINAYMNLNSATQGIQGTYQMINGANQLVYDPSVITNYNNALAGVQQAIKDTINSGQSVPKSFTDFLNIQPN